MQQRKGTLNSCLKIAPSLDHLEVVPSSQSELEATAVRSPQKQSEVSFKRKCNAKSFSYKRAKQARTTVTSKACWKLGVHS